MPCLFHITLSGSFVQMKQKSPSRMSSLAQKIKMAQSAVRKFYPAVAPASGSHVPESDDKVLVLALQAETVVPKLTVMKRGGALRDPDPKSGGKAPTLKLQMASTATPRMVSSDIAVANDSLTDVVFHIVTDAPFSLLPKPSATAFKHPLASSSPSTTASASRKGGKAKPGNATNWYKLDPRGNLELTVFYKWSGPTAAQLQLNGAAAELPPMEEESGSMWIKYVNGETQEIKLRGVVKRPVVEVGLNRGVVPPAFNFGLLHAGVDMDGDGVADTMVCDSDANVTVLYLGNRTHVPATWSVSHVKSTATSEFVDDPSVFALAQTEGVRQGPTVPVDSGLIWNRLPEGSCSLLSLCVCMAHVQLKIVLFSLLQVCITSKRAACPLQFGFTSDQSLTCNTGALSASMLMVELARRLPSKDKEHSKNSTTNCSSK